MTAETSSQITTRLFLGIRQTPDINMALNQSKEWAQDQIATSGENAALKTVRHAGKDYLGVSIDSNSISMNDMQTTEEQIREQLQRYCPKLRVQGLRVYAFAQVLVY